MTKKVTIQDLKKAQCYDLSIPTLPSGQDFLILVCKEKDGSNMLLEILRQNAFDIKIYVNETTQQYYLRIEFIDTDIALKLETGRTEIDYPPLKKLKDNKIKFITTGVWTGQSSVGGNYEFNGQFIRLGELDLGKSFGQAFAIHFAAGRNEMEPSMLVLIFENYDHILWSEADEAYNKLTKLAISKPLLEIDQQGDVVNLRIWDILMELDVKIQDLPFDPQELEEFLQSTEPNKSFAFLLGFFEPGDKRPIIALTKKEGFEIITLRGYIHKKDNSRKETL